MDIGRSARRLRDALAAWRQFDALVERTITGLLQILVGSCKHPGAATGYNERDGSWMNPCPVCGHSY
jgi:hypothetical protein